MRNLGFQKDSNLEGAQRCFRNKQAAVIRQLVDVGKAGMRSWCKKIDIVTEMRPSADFAILET